MNPRAHCTIADATLRHHSLMSDGLLVVAGSIFIALLAQIAIPVGPVPVTGQTIGVLLTAAVLGRRRGSLAVATYLAEGALGLPVFAGGRAGIVVLAGPTGGYLVGFLAAAIIVGALADAGFDRKPVTTFAAMAAGSASIYLFGVFWLARFTGWDSVLGLGVTPFLFGDALKAAVATLLLPSAWRFVRKR